MQKRSILIIAEKEYHITYQGIFLDERVEIHTFQDAVEIIKNCKADVILIDSGFDIEKGLSLLKATKNFCLNIPVILLTAVSSEDSAIAAFKLGVRDYIKKPISVSELKNIIEKILTLKKGVKERRSPYISRELDKDVLAVVDNNTAIVRDIIKYINDNLSETISLDELAKKANMSKYHFCRLFKKYTGKSPMNFVSFMRVEKAKELLKKGEDTWSVSFKIGFSNPGSLSRHFKRLTGLTPKEYRKSILRIED